MSTTQLALEAVATGVLLFGGYHGYRAYRKCRIPLPIFLFFPLVLFPQFVGLLGSLLSPILPNISPIIWLRLSQVGYWMLRLAFALLAYGCYLSNIEQKPRHTKPPSRGSA